MKTSSLIVLIAGIVLAALLGLGLFGAAVGYAVYHRTHAPAFPIADPTALEATPTVDAAMGFQMRAPSGWHLKADSSRRRTWLSVIPGSFDGQFTTSNINVATDTYSGSDYVSAGIRTLQRDHPDFRLLSNRRVMIDGHVAQIIDYTFTSKVGVPLHLQQTIIPSGSLVFIITAVADVRAWEARRVALESSAASFEFTR